MGSNIRQLDLNDSSPLSNAINNMHAKQQQVNDTSKQQEQVKSNIIDIAKQQQVNYDKTDISK